VNNQNSGHFLDRAHFRKIERKLSCSVFVRYCFPMVAELKSKSFYSFLNGGSSPEELVKTAHFLGLSALALTDSHGVYGIPKAWGALREVEGGERLKLISGGELTLVHAETESFQKPVKGDHENGATQGTHAKGEIEEGTDPGGTGVKTEDSSKLVLLATDRRSYGALCRLFSEAHRNQPKGKAALTRAQALTLLKTLPGGGDLLLFPEWEDRLSEQSFLEEWGGFQENFPGSFYLPLSYRWDGRDAERLKLTRRLSQHYGLQVVAHNDVLYHSPERQELQDVLSCIREGKTLREGGFLLQKNAERYLKSPRQMRELFRDFPEAIQGGLEAAERCTFLPSELRYRYPSEWIPTGLSAQTYLEFLCEAGKKKRYPRGVSEAVEKQLRHELKLISELNFADYFITVYDIVDFARKKDILCQGRGSAANSVVCYLLEITAIDPVQMNLLFERFISSERGEPPDIDVDFEHERREEVIQYIYEKYGRDRAAMVSAVVTYRTRSSLREVAKCFGVEVGTLSARKVRELIETPGVITEKVGRKIEKICETMESFPRHLSIHSGGFTLSADPLIEIVPIEPASMEGRTIIQWDKYDLDILGLLKIDVLSLGMLTALQKCLKLRKFELAEIPHDDEKTYAMIQAADTIGTFQIESRAQMSMLPRLKPANFYDLVIEVALVRPGPIVGKMVHPFLKRRRGIEKWVCPDPRLEPILGRTHGVPIFQEQIMKMAVTLAGFTPGEADKLRKAIGAWRSAGSLDEMGKKLMAGLLKAGLPLQFAEEIFQQIQGFSEYGFPESHSASFSLLAYASCYLKCHYPAEFLVAMLNSQPLGFYAPHTLVDDAKRHGVVVHPISLSRSAIDTEMERENSNEVRLGFHQIHGLQRREIDRILIERQKRPFSSLQDFTLRTRIRLNALKVLALGDFFREFGLNQREALWQILSAQVSMQSALFQSEWVQADLFPSATFEKLDPYEEVMSDYRSYGLSHRGHPMKWVREKVAQSAYRIPKSVIEMNSQKAKTFPSGKRISILGLSLVMQRPPTANGTAFATLEDECGFLDLILHREVYERVRKLMMNEPFVIVKGKTQRDGAACSFIVDEVKACLRPDEEELQAKIGNGFGHNHTAAGGVGQVSIPDSPGSIARRYGR
jgi:error-prone DNA polymerase